MSDKPDLAELEMAFAKDPASNAFIPLSQAYLEQGRFMEAMVVCKKGIRSQPEHVEGRLLLAKVYAGQGKVPKAIDEVKRLLEQDASIAEAHFFLGQLHERSGRFEDAIEAFKAALTLDRHHGGAREALQAKGIDFDPGPSEEELEAQRQAEAEAARRAEEARQQAEMEAAISAAPTPAPGMGNGVGTQPPGGAQRPSTPPTGVSSQPPSPAHSGAFATQTYFGGYDPLAEQQAARKKLGLGFSFGLGALLLLLVVGLFAFMRSYSQDAEAIAALSKDAKRGYLRDTSFSLKKSVEGYEEILKIDDDHETAVARAAYIYTRLRYQRGMRDLDDKVSTALARAEEIAPKHPITVAARMVHILHQRLDVSDPDASRKKYAAEALAKLEAFVATLEEGQIPPVELREAEGKAMLMQGQFGTLRPFLEKHFNPQTLDRPGALAFGGEAYNRLGDDQLSMLLFNVAIKIEPDHDVARSQRALLFLQTRDLGNLYSALDDVSHLVDLGKTQLGPTQRGYSFLGRAEFNRLLDKKEQADRDFEEAKKQLGPDPEVWFFEARWAFAAEKHAEGVAALQKSVKADPNRIRPWAELVAEAASTRSTRDDAEAAYEQAKKIFGDHPSLIEARVELYGRNKDLDGAYKYLQDLEKTQNSSTVQREMGRVFLARGGDKNLKKAIALLDTAKEMAEKDKASKLEKASTATLLGRAHASANNHAAAIDAYKDALRVAGSYAQAYYFLGKSLRATDQTAAAKEAFNQAAKLDPVSEMGKAAKRSAEAIE